MKLVKRKERWTKAAARRGDSIYRARKCPNCHFVRPTVEFEATSPRSKTPPHTCPACGVGHGVVRSVKYVDSRWLGHSDAKICGAVVRRRRCQECAHHWYTYETALYAARCRDVSRCECGTKMNILAVANE